MKKRIDGLVQIVVYLQVPLLEMLDEKQLKLNKKQAAILENTRLSLPYYSPDIFETDDDAKKCVPIFITQLIKKELLPPEVLNEDRSVNNELIRVGLVTLNITKLEIEQARR